MLSRRQVLVGTSSALVLAALPRAASAIGAQWRTAASAAQIAAAEPEIVNAPAIRTTAPKNFRVITEGLRLPEGPIAMADGSVLLVECEGRTLTRCTTDGKVEVVAELGGGPNGAAIGPDGACYVANNGGFEWAPTPGGLLLPAGIGNYKGGSIQRVDLRTGAVTTLYEAVDGRRLSSPNDLVFDAHGGFWFTDWGKPRARSRDHGGLYYARADGSLIREVVFPLLTPNGVGLSPDGKTVYVSESESGRLLAGAAQPEGTTLSLVTAPGGNTHFDSMALEADGGICVATVTKGGITRIAAADGMIEHTPLPDLLTTNLAFGGNDLRTCFVTLSGRGQLAAIDWPRPGLKLRYNA